MTEEVLIAAGFAVSADWTLAASGEIRLDRRPPKTRGVYAFVVDGQARYVGVATMGLAKRLYFYGSPGATQKTSQRLNLLLAELLAGGTRVAVYTAQPPNLMWNGLPISGDVGLELGLIEAFDLPWNKRGTHGG